MTRRMDRVNVLLRQEISRILSTDIKDPRLPELVSVTRVETAADLRHAKVFVSVLGQQPEKKGALLALRSAASFIRRGLRRSLDLRAVPYMEFVLDESMEQAAELMELMKEVAPRPDSDGAPAG